MVSSFVGSVPIGVIIDVILFGSALLAMAAARFLPEHHLSPETKGVVSVSVAVVGTLSALVVGLLISNSNTSFTAKSQEVTQISADVINLDRMLRRYGPEAQDIRVLQSPSKLKMVFKGGQSVDITTPIPERREYSWERNKVYLQGLVRYDDTLNRGYISRL